MMKFGVNILNFGSQTDPSGLRRWALATEELGYHFLMVSDHVAVTEDVKAHYPTPFYDPFVNLAWFAGITQKIELGISVSDPSLPPSAADGAHHRQPRPVSAGRALHLRRGRGWAKQEFEALGVPFERHGAITDEYLSAIKDCWTKEMVSSEGEFVSFRDVHTAPMPVRSPHPPIWVGGSSEPALRRAVRYGDAWHPIHESLPWLGTKVSRGCNNWPMPKASACPPSVQGSAG